MSIIHVTDSKKSGLSADRTPFYGGKTPEEIRAMIKQIKHVDRTTWRKMLQIIISTMEGNQIENEQITSLESTNLTNEKLASVYSGLLKLIQKAMRSPSLKQEMMKEDLQGLRLTEDFISDVVTVVFKAKQSPGVEKCLYNFPTLPKLQTFNWRTDVAISTNVLNRVLEPSILMDLTLSDGSVHNIEVPVSKFHELRYNVAFMLKEMENLEKRNILKVQD